jgi:hypothetical protein
MIGFELTLDAISAARNLVSYPIPRHRMAEE